MVTGRGQGDQGGHGQEHQAGRLVWRARQVYLATEGAALAPSQPLREERRRRDHHATASGCRRAHLAAPARRAAHPGEGSPKRARDTPATTSPEDTGNITAASAGPGATWPSPCAGRTRPGGTVTYRERQRLADIQAAIDAIGSHLQRGDLSDGRASDAVRIRLLEIGEAGASPGAARARTGYRPARGRTAGRTTRRRPAAPPDSLTQLGRRLLPPADRPAAAASGSSAAAASGSTRKSR